MTLEKTVIAVREYHEKCRDKNLENYTSNGIEIDPHTLTWAEYWLTKMLNKERQKDCEVVMKEKISIEFSKEEFDKIMKYMDCGNFETVQERLVKQMDKLLDIALWILVPIAILLAICVASIVVALVLYLFFGVKLFGLM